MEFRERLNSYTAAELMNGAGIELLKSAIDYNTFLVIREMIACRILDSLESGDSGLSEKAPIPILEFKRQCDELALTDERFKDGAMADAIVNILINNNADPNKVKGILELALELYDEEMDYESE